MKKQESYGPGYISLLRIGAFYTNFSITILEFLFVL